MNKDFQDFVALVASTAVRTFGSTAGAVDIPALMQAKPQTSSGTTTKAATVHEALGDIISTIR
jgi:hypothetical protein